MFHASASTQSRSPVCRALVASSPRWTRCRADGGYRKAGLAVLLGAWLAVMAPAQITVRATTVTQVKVAAHSGSKVIPANRDVTAGYSLRATLQRWHYSARGSASLSIQRQGATTTVRQEVEASSARGPRGSASHSVRITFAAPRPTRATLIVDFAGRAAGITLTGASYSGTAEVPPHAPILCRASGGRQCEPQRRRFDVTITASGLSITLAQGSGAGSSLSTASGARGHWQLELTPARRTGRFVPAASGDRFGSVLAAVGDVDGDGHGDLAIGHPGANRNSGEAILVSGKDHGVRRWSGAAGERLGRALAGGDLDDDGYSDVCVGAPAYGEQGEGAVYVWWGGRARTSRWLVGRSGFGHCVALGSFDRLAGADLVATDRHNVELVAFSSKTDHRLWTAALPAPATAVTVIGDVDSDGYDDVAVGMPTAGDARGVVEVRSGLQGRVIWTAAGRDPDQRFGWSIAAVGDLDGDAIPELAVGSPFGGSVERGVLTVLLGLNGRVRREVRGGDRDRLGYALAPAGDVDQDGTPDILVSSVPTGATAKGRLLTLSGTTLKDIGTPRVGTTPNYGWAVASLETNGDDRLDTAIGEPPVAGNNGGTTWLHDDQPVVAPPRFARYGTTCKGASGFLPRIHGSNGGAPDRVLGARARVGGRYRLFLTAARASTPTALRIARERDDLSVDHLGAPGCFSLTKSFFIDIPVRTDSKGMASIPLAIPNSDVFLGSDWTHQWIVVDPVNPLGAVASDAAAVKIGARE